MNNQIDGEKKSGLFGWVKSGLKSAVGVLGGTNELSAKISAIMEEHNHRLDEINKEKKQNEREMKMLRVLEKEFSSDQADFFKWQEEIR